MTPRSASRSAGLSPTSGSISSLVMVRSSRRR